MKLLVILSVGALLATSCLAAQTEKMYYVGEAQLSSPTGEPRGSQVILLEKIHNPDANLITERAIVAKPDHTVDQYTMTMKVSGNSFSITDEAKTIQGNGTLFGPAWHWTYFKANYESTNGAKIEDENYMVDPDVLVARKKVSAPDGKVLIYMDVTLKSITAPTFEVLAGSLLKK